MTTPVTKRASSPVPLDETPLAKKAAVGSVEAELAKRTLRDRREYEELEEGPSAKRAHKEKVVDLTYVAENINPAMDIIVRHLTEKETAALMATNRACHQGVQNALPVNPFDPQGRKLFFETLREHPLLSQEVLACLHPSISQQEPIAILRNIQRVTSRVIQGTLSPDDALACLVKQVPEGDALEPLVNLMNALSLEDTMLKKDAPTGVLDLIFIIIMSQKCKPMMERMHPDEEVYDRDKVFNNVFAQAARDRRKDIIKLLIETPETKEKIRDEIIRYCFRDHFVTFKKIDMMRFFLETPEIREKISDDTIGEAVVAAAHRGRIDCLKFLLLESERGVEIGSEFIREAFRHAVGWGKTEAATFLLKESGRGTEITAKDIAKGCITVIGVSRIEQAREFLQMLDTLGRDIEIDAHELEQGLVNFVKKPWKDHADNMKLFLELAKKKDIKISAKTIREVFDHASSRGLENNVRFLLVESGRGADMTAEAIRKHFKSQTSFGTTNDLKFLLEESGRGTDITSEFLEEVFLWHAQYGSINFLRFLLLESGRGVEISAATIRKGFNIATALGIKDTMKLLLVESGRGADITAKDITDAFNYTIVRHREDILKFLLEDSGRDADVTPDKVGEIFKTAASNYRDDTEMKMIINSRKFADIPVEDLVWAFTHARDDRRRDLIRNSSRFIEIRDRVEPPPVRAPVGPPANAPVNPPAADTWFSRCVVM